jgi:multiple sugar transport system permease protein
MWRRVAMPLVRPVTIAVALLAFIASWGNFLEPLVYLFDADLYTLPLGLRSLSVLDRTNHPVLLAGAVVATAPVVVAFAVAQRYFLHEDRGAGWLGR